jgi:hypothetical protein
VLFALVLAWPVAAGEVCLDREGVWRERLPGALFAWEYHVYVDHSQIGTWSSLRPHQIRDVLVDAGWGPLDDRELLRLGRVISEQGSQVKTRDQGCGVRIAARAVDRPPAGHVIWQLEIESRGTPKANGVCDADCFGH